MHKFFVFDAKDDRSSFGKGFTVEADHFDFKDGHIVFYVKKELNHLATRDVAVAAFPANFSVKIQEEKK